MSDSVSCGASRGPPTRSKAVEAATAARGLAASYTSHDFAVELDSEAAEQLPSRADLLGSTLLLVVITPLFSKGIRRGLDFETASLTKAPKNRVQELNFSLQIQAYSLESSTPRILLAM